MTGDLAAGLAFIVLVVAVLFTWVELIAFFQDVRRIADALDPPEDEEDQDPDEPIPTGPTWLARDLTREEVEEFERTNDGDYEVIERRVRDWSPRTRYDIRGPQEERP